MNGSFIIPLAKVDVEKRLVIGRAVQEMVDKSGEILDYASARPAFEAWSKEMSDASGGLSKGNLRVMHSKTVAGKVVEITYNDDEKAIDVVTKVVDDNEWRKVLEGCYTGFSVGGSYAKKWKVGTNTHYTPKVSELSLVDMPCIPSAKFFELHKADGAIEKIEFKTVAVVDSDETPEVGDTIEFNDDAFVESGPCNCKVGAVDGDHLALDMGEDSNPDIVDWNDVAEDGAAMAAPREDGKPRRWFVSRKSADKSVEPEQLMKRAKVDREKVAKVMAEFKAGTLKSSDGSTVTDRKQAMAIAMSEARLGKAEKPKRERKAKGKDGRAGRDGDGDGKKNESGDSNIDAAAKKIIGAGASAAESIASGIGRFARWEGEGLMRIGAAIGGGDRFGGGRGNGNGNGNGNGGGGAGGSPPAAAALPPEAKPIKVEVVGQVSPKSGVIPGTRMEPALSYAGLAAGAAGGAALGRFALSRRGLRTWQGLGGTLPNRLVGAAGRTAGTLTAHTYNAVTPSFLNLGGDAVRSIGAAGEKAGQAIGSGVQAIRRAAMRGAFHGVYLAAGGPKRTKMIGGAIGAAYLGYQGFRGGRLLGSEIDRWRSREVDLTRAWAPLDLSKAFNESKVKRDERGRFSSTGAAAAGVAAGAAAGAAIGYGFGRGKSKTAAAADAAAASGVNVKEKSVTSQFLSYVSKNVVTPLKRQAIKWGKEGVKGFKDLPFPAKLKIAIGLGGVGAKVLQDVANLGYEYRTKDFGFEVDLVLRDDKGKVKHTLWSYDSISGDEKTFSFSKKKDEDEVEGGDADEANGKSTLKSDAGWKVVKTASGESAVFRPDLKADSPNVSPTLRNDYIADFNERRTKGTINEDGTVAYSNAVHRDDRLNSNDKNLLQRKLFNLTGQPGTDEFEGEVSNKIASWHKSKLFSTGANSELWAKAAKRLVESNISSQTRRSNLHASINQAKEGVSYEDAWRKINQRSIPDIPAPKFSPAAEPKATITSSDLKSYTPKEAEQKILRAKKEADVSTVDVDDLTSGAADREVHRWMMNNDPEYRKKIFGKAENRFTPDADVLAKFDESKIKRGSNGKFASKSGMISSGTGYAGSSLAWHAVGDRISHGFASTWPGKIVSTGAKIGASLAGSNIGERGGRFIESTLGIKQRKMGRFEDYGRIAGGLVGGIAGGLGLGVAGAIAGSVVPGAGTIAGGLAARVAGDTVGSMVGEAAGGWIGRYLDGRNTPAAAPAAAGRFAPPKQRAPRAPRASKGLVAPRALRSSGAARAQPTVTT